MLAILYYCEDATGSIAQPSHGSSTFSGSDVVYDPNTDFCGTDTFTYTVMDASQVNSDTATVTVDVLCPSEEIQAPTADGNGPIANDDFATTTQGSSVVIFVMKNDIVPSDAAGSFSAPSNGVLEKGSSELVYHPNAGFCGQDSFSYTLSNDKSSNSATVTIDVVCDEGITQEIIPPADNDGLLLMDDFAEGEMDKALSISILVNDIIPTGE